MMETIGIDSAPPQPLPADHGFSVIIPVKAINSYLRESIPIVLAIDYDAFEVIILPDDPPQGDLPAWTEDPRVAIVPTGPVSPAIKRDLGAERARFDRLAFLDDDAYPQADWLRQAEKAFRDTGAAAIGGPGITPPDSPLVEQASGLFFESLIGGGGMDYRYRPAKKAFSVDDYPTVNFLVSKWAFLAVGGFDNVYWPGEDTKLCLDLVKAGYTIWYSPDVVVFHHRRPRLALHMQQVGNYGRHRGHFARILPETSARPAYFVPSLFLLGSAGLVALGFVWPTFWKIYGMLMLVYFVVAAVDVFSRTANPALGFLTILTIYCSHLVYGFMFLKGFFTRRAFRSTLR
jgi:cellulose synthase/poly-beta-1,6-N-acetylglucosamine synthase-like glycosyltransferase